MKNNNAIAQCRKRQRASGDTDETINMDGDDPPSCLAAIAKRQRFAFATKFTPLMSAAASNDVGLARKLIAVGDDLNVVDGDARRSALHWAAFFESVETTMALVLAGADRTIRDASGDTARDIALRSASNDLRAIFSSFLASPSSKKSAHHVSADANDGELLLIVDEEDDDDDMLNLDMELSSFLNGSASSSVVLPHCLPSFHPISSSSSSLSFI
jgi:Ankyrin repeat